MTRLRNTTRYTAGLRQVEFPFERRPDDFAPEQAILRLPDGDRVHSYLWCYLQRASVHAGTEFSLASLSAARIEALPRVLERISKAVRFDGIRPRSIKRELGCLSQFLLWADAAEHRGRFELVLTNADLALNALVGYHTYLRQRVQSHQVDQKTAALRDQRAIKLLSDIHDRTYRDEIEPLASRKGGNAVPVPEDGDVAAFMSTLQAVFDSAARLILDGEGASIRSPIRTIQLSATDDAITSVLPTTYSSARLMELACVVFAGLVFGDSGANQAQIQAFEEPEDLFEQLDHPDRISLTRRVVKMRAGGRLVPVSLSTTTITRVQTYLAIRSRLVAFFDGMDVAPMFVQCRYGHQIGQHGKGDPLGLCSLSESFLGALRNKVRIVGGNLPRISLRQLRLYKQQYLVRHHGVRVAAEAMGHSVVTAITAYCRTQESVRRSELGYFLASLQTTVLDRAEGAPDDSGLAGIAIGACASHGKPKPIDAVPVVRPDCKSSEGCFFCTEYRLHADEHDLRKLLSCRFVLSRLAHVDRDVGPARRAYVATLDRIEALLSEIQRRNPKVHEETIQDVEVAGNLTPYWAAKLQQLHLLGMLAPTS